MHTELNKKEESMFLCCYKWFIEQSKSDGSFYEWLRKEYDITVQFFQNDLRYELTYATEEGRIKFWLTWG